ncbi:MAG: hypothetical protein KAH18_01465 [Psychromonas sp.]|nr:hypothetical protein [Psychromonas sp.]
MICLSVFASASFSIINFILALVSRQLAFAISSTRQIATPSFVLFSRLEYKQFLRRIAFSAPLLSIGTCPSVKIQLTVAVVI